MAINIIRYAQAERIRHDGDGVVAHPPEEPAVEKQWETLNKVIDLVGNKFLGSLLKMSQHSIPQKLSTFFKKASESACCVTTLQQIIAGKITLSEIDKVISKVLTGGAYTDEDLKILSSVLGLRELISNECDASLREKVFKVLRIPVSFISKFEEQIKELAKTEQTVLGQISFLTKSLPALGIYGKLEKMEKAIEVIDNPETHQGKVPKAVCDLAGVVLGLGSYALSFVSGVPSSVTLGLGAAAAVAGFVGLCLEPPKSKEQKSVEDAIKKDLALLKVENDDQHRSTRKWDSNHPDSVQFHTFNQWVQTLLGKIEDAHSSKDLIDILEKYLQERSQLTMFHKPIESEKAIRDLINVLKTALKQETAD